MYAFLCHIWNAQKTYVHKKWHIAVHTYVRMFCIQIISNNEAIWSCNVWNAWCNHRKTPQTPILPDDTLRGVMLICGAVVAVIANLKLDRQRANAERSENTPRDRTRVKLKILSMNPATFKRNYRLDRVSFMDLLSKITPDRTTA